MTLIETTQLNKSLMDQMRQLYFSQKYISIAQLPDFPTNQTGNVRYFYYLENGVMMGYVICKESALSKLKFIRTASMTFGVIANDKETQVTILEGVIAYYKKEKFTELQIDPFLYPFPISKFEKELQDISTFQRGTVLIDLSLAMNEIESSFSTNLKRNLKKAEKLGLEVREICTEGELAEFCEIHSKMSQSRGVNHHSNAEIRATIQNIKENKIGNVFCCFLDGKMLGGIVGIHQGNRYEYYIGATDPESRNLPQSHLTHYFAIKFAKDKDIAFYDFGGVVTNATEEDQVFHITNFKFHFSKKVVLYTQLSRMNLSKWRQKVKKAYLKLASR